MSGEQTSFLAAAADPAAPAEGGEAAPAQTSGEGGKPSLLGAQQTQQGTTPEQSGQGKPTTPAPVEVSVPEGVELDKGFLEAVKAGDPQKVVDAYLAQQKAADAEWAKQGQAWVQQVRSDPELGGANLQATEAACRKAMARFGSPALAKTLVEFGLDNHPELVRAFARMGKAIGEDSIAGTATSAEKQAPADDYTSMARRLFKNSPEMFERN
jgi:hypothetical protein